MVAKKVRLGDVPIDCQVYLFYFHGYERYEELEKALFNWGKTTGKNLYVGFWGRDDRDYPKVAQMFSLAPLPAIIITGRSSVASINENTKPTTLFGRIDNKEILTNTQKIMDSLEVSYNYFIRGLIKEALAKAKKANEISKIDKYFGKVKDWLGRSVGDFLKEHDIKINLLKGLFEFESSPSKE